MTKCKQPTMNLPESDVTDESVYRNRRMLLKQLGFVGAGALLTPHASAGLFGLFSKSPDKAIFNAQALKFAADSVASNDVITDELKATRYNNFYEFGTSKTDPFDNGQAFKTQPWSLSVDGLVENNITLDYDQLFSKISLIERIYRLRCVEAWSMVIPWVGFELSQLLALAKPLSSAKYVVFKTLYDPEQFPGQKNRFVGGGIDYPYVEGLTIEEAQNPLTLLSVGMYGKTLPPQNGAPIRLVVPWKYGFKSIKSIVSITLTDSMPKTTWNILAPNEYGFYANVNPEVAHPRWSQASERRITSGGVFEQKRIPTLPFNGYAEQVAHLYKNIDLTKNY